MKRCDSLAEMYGPWILSLATRKSQQLPRKRFTARGSGEDRLKRTNILLVGRPAQKRLRLTAYDHQQVVEVVRDAAGQLTEGFHFLRLRELFVGAFERFLRIALFRDVPRDLGKADKFAELVADRVDDNVGPEQGPVLAHAPRFGLESTRCRGDRQRAVRESGLAIFRCIELRKILTDDFIGRVALMRSAPAFQLDTTPVGLSMYKA